IAAVAAASGVAGHWNVAVDGPHGAMVLPLVLEQSGDKVTATLSTPHGDEMHLTGTFVKDTLEIATASDGDDSHQTTMKATLQSDGKLKGFLSSPMGDMAWSAERAKDK